MRPAGIVATISSSAERAPRATRPGAGAALRDEVADDLEPVAPEVDEQRERGADVERDEEREEEALAPTAPSRGRSSRAARR